MARGEPKDPIRKGRAEAVRADMGRAWEARQGDTLSVTRAGMRLEFYRPPDFILDADGEIVGVDAWVRLYDAQGEEVRIDPHRRIINPPTVPRSGVRWEPSQSRNQPPVRTVTPDPMAAFTEAVWDSVEEAPNPPGWRTRGTVTTVYSGTADGFLSSNADVGGEGETYSQARAGTTISLSASTGGTTVQTGQFYENDGDAINVYSVYEVFLGFDTSSIPDSATVSAADLALWLTRDGSTTDFTIEARQDDWAPTLTSADWVAGASLSSQTLLASIATAGIGATGAYKTFTSQAALLTATNMKTGTVSVSISSSRTRVGNTPSANVDETMVFSAADQSGTTQDPKLTITHAGGDAAGPPLFQNNPQRIWRRF